MKQDMEDIIPEGKVRLEDGRIIDRSKCGFLLQQHPEKKELFRASDNTLYHRSAAGTLRRINNKKLSKADRKAEKRRRHNGPTPPNPLFTKEGEPNPHPGIKAGAFEEVVKEDEK